MSDPKLREGLGVDSKGNPSVDPSENVKALSEAANKRQDDLRVAEGRFVVSELQRIAETLKGGLVALQDEMKLRAEHAKEINALESNRLNAIRQVDVLAVNTAADRAAAAIQALAATTAANAETLRAMVANTATTIASQLQNTVMQITERIAALEKSSYEGKGKQAMADPQMVELISKVSGLTESRATGAGRAGGLHAGWAILVGAVGLIGAIVAIMAAVMKNSP